MMTNEEVQELVNKMLPGFPESVVVAIPETQDVSDITDRIQSVVQQMVVLYLVSQGEGALIVENDRLKLAVTDNQDWKTKDHPYLVENYRKVAKSAGGNQG